MQTAKKKPFWGDGDQCFRINQWGRIKRSVRKTDLPVCGPNGDPIPYTDLRLNELVFFVDASGDGWSVARLQPEMKVTMTERDATTTEMTEKPSGVFIQVVIPTNLTRIGPVDMNHMIALALTTWRSKREAIGPKNLSSPSSYKFLLLQ